MAEAELPTLQQRLTAMLADVRPERLLLVSDDDALAQVLGDHAPQRLAGAEAWPRLGDCPAASLAIVDGEAAVPPADVTPLLGRLRDVYAGQVLVIGPASPREAWSRHTLIGLGFRGFGATLDGNHRRPWYQFDIVDYKVTPDWLSPRHWAHPELWDKFRW
ncbi:hypothetical protein DEM34_07040 [Spiribacter halobius]|uniref:Uncharacterized protein n=2 Tax=Sediminicurvatus halobius TaxID=2182432 RepID=A0A2U2N4C8_9GAMM|nr:hypothetical protein DEM34_07040 [Spiribacter halobius]